MYFGGSILLCDYERMRPGVRRAARYAEGLFPKYRRAGLRLCHIEAVWNASALEKGEFLAAVPPRRCRDGRRSLQFLRRGPSGSFGCDNAQ